MGRESQAKAGVPNQNDSNPEIQGHPHSETTGQVELHREGLICQGKGLASLWRQETPAGSKQGDL